MGAEKLTFVRDHRTLRWVDPNDPNKDGTVALRLRSPNRGPYTTTFDMAVPTSPDVTPHPNVYDPTYSRRTTLLSYLGRLTTTFATLYKPTANPNWKLIEEGVRMVKEEISLDHSFPSRAYGPDEVNERLRYYGVALESLYGATLPDTQLDPPTVETDPSELPIHPGLYQLMFQATTIEANHTDIG